MSDNKPSAFLMKQVTSELDNIFSSLIDLSDLEGKKTNHRQEAFKSRALTAYSLYTLAEVTPSKAADAVVDGYDDNGIDGLLFDQKQNILWLVQSKWKKDGKGSPKASDMRSFKDGIFDLLDFQNYKDRFHSGFESKEDEIESAIRSPGLQIKVVITYTGDKLAKHSRDVLEDIVTSINDGNEIASIEELNLDGIYKTITERHTPENIEAQFELYDWGRIDEPYQAVYGRICAEDVAKWWVKHRNKLFNKNIREFIGGSSVNDDITETVISEPELFWYFNNGITVLCDEIISVGAKKHRKVGEFQAKGISVVNGAQSIGCLANLYQSDSAGTREKLEDVEVQIRFISLNHSEESFSSKVTRATNTQNKVENRDFIALDKQQERLGREFRTLGKIYHYKRTAENIVRDDKNYELEEGTVALACSSKDIKLAIDAKQDISKLWSNPEKSPYTKLFNSHVDAMCLSRKIEVRRKVDQVIKNMIDQNPSKIRDAFLRHGDLFLLHMIFQKSPPEIFQMNTSEQDFAGYLTQDLPQITTFLLETLEKHLTKTYKPGKLWSFFRSPKKMQELSAQVLM